jgi:hypothetical protein
MGREGIDDWMEDQPINATSDIRSSTNFDRRDTRDFCAIENINITHIRKQWRRMEANCMQRWVKKALSHYDEMPLSLQHLQ